MAGRAAGIRARLTYAVRYGGPTSWRRPTTAALRAAVRPPSSLFQSEHPIDGRARQSSMTRGMLMLQGTPERRVGSIAALVFTVRPVGCRVFCFAGSCSRTMVPVSTAERAQR
jgi:hypothetical protein